MLSLFIVCSEGLGKAMNRWFNIDTIKVFSTIIRPKGVKSLSQFFPYLNNLICAIYFYHYKLA